MCIEYKDVVSDQSMESLRGVFEVNHSSSEVRASHPENKPQTIKNTNKNYDEY